MHASARAAATGALATVALVASLGLSGCFGWSISKAAPTGPTAGAGGNSSLSEAGAEQIERTGRAEFDWSSGRLLREDVGLTGSGDFANGVSARGPGHPIEVTVRAPNATIRVSSERILPYVVDGADEVEELWLTARAESDGDFVELVRRTAALAGAENQGLTTWLESYSSDPHGTCTTLGYNTPEGTATGLRVWLEMSCKWEPSPKRFLSVHIASPGA